MTPRRRQHVGSVSRRAARVKGQPKRPGALGVRTKRVDGSMLVCFLVREPPRRSIGWVTHRFLSDAKQSGPRFFKPGPKKDIHDHDAILTCRRLWPTDRSLLGVPSQSDSTLLFNSKPFSVGVWQLLGSEGPLKRT